MKERLTDLYVCIILAVALRFVFKDDTLYLISAFFAGVGYAYLKETMK